MCGALVFVAATQEMASDHQALETRDLSPWVPQDYNNLRDCSSGRLPLPRHCTDSRLTPTPSLSEKHYLLVQELQPAGQASGLAHF